MTDAAPTAASDTLPPTDMLYLEYDGNFLTRCEAKVLQVQPAGDKFTICLDQSVLHAQGGGQPTDTGRLTVASSMEDEGDDQQEVKVEKVLLNRETGVAAHTCQFIGSSPQGTEELSPVPPLSVGDAVVVQVDEDRRRLLSECHTAGHVVDSAMARAGLALKPSKGYHFLDGPYVEYQGQIPPDERPQVLKNLQRAFGELVDEQIDTKIELLGKDEADALCNRQAQNFDLDVFADKRTNQVRVVTVAGYPCPCGGTHVRNTSDLKERQWGITGIKAKKGVVRVKYGQGCQSWL